MARVRPARSSSPTPELAQFAPAIRWLRQRGVGTSRLSAAFGTTPAHIRLLSFRANHTASSTAPTLRAKPMVRMEEDTVQPSTRRQLKITMLEERISAIFYSHVSSYRFVHGITALRQVLPDIGYPASVALIRLRAQVHAHIAWFAGHSGLCETALANSRRAIELRRLAYRQTRLSIDVQAIADSALVTANAFLLQQNPRRALQTLQLVRHAQQQQRNRFGAEYLRQHAVAFLQLGEDREAVLGFQRSIRAMQDQGRSRADAALAGQMRLNLLARAVESQLEILDVVRQQFGTASLEAAMATNWAAACAFATDSRALRFQAADLLAKSTPQARFGHQATARALLQVTPELELNAPMRGEWVRYALYFNAFRRQ